MYKKVAILTINFTSYKETLELLENLKILKGNFEVFVLENGSPINSIKKEDLPPTLYPLHFYNSKKNLGFAGGNNLLITKAQRQNFDYFWLLNNDTQVEEDSLINLLKVFKEHKNAGIVGSLVIQNGNKVWWAGSIVDLNKGRILKKYYGENIENVKLGIFKTDEINGAVMLIKKEVIEKIGLLDTAFFHTAEDTDYSIRAKKYGFELYINTSSKVYHGVGKSSGGSYSPLHMFYVERGRIMLMRKWKKLNLKSIIFLIPLWIKRVSAPIVKKRDFKSSVYTIKGIVEGFTREV